MSRVDEWVRPRGGLWRAQSTMRASAPGGVGRLAPGAGHPVRSLRDGAGASGASRLPPCSDPSRVRPRLLDSPSHRRRGGRSGREGEPLRGGAAREPGFEPGTLLQRAFDRRGDPHAPPAAMGRFTMSQYCTIQLGALAPAGFGPVSIGPASRVPTETRPEAFVSSAESRNRALRTVERRPRVERARDSVSVSENRSLSWVTRRPRTGPPFDFVRAARGTAPRRSGSIHRSPRRRQSRRRRGTPRGAR